MLITREIGRKTVLLLLTFISLQTFAQDFFTHSDSLHTQRKNAVYLTYGSGVVLTYTGLYSLWYRQQGLSGFRFHDDSRDWKQMDKIGHTATAYQLGELGMKSLMWAGVERRKAMWQGSLSGLIFLTGVEIFDGFSPSYGFSTTDMLANVAGSMLLIGQELAWEEQRIRLKFSFFPSGYAQYRPELLGHNLSEQWLKDYNGQTYWLSMNIASMTQWENMPKWLNLALGYSAGGMTGSLTNPTHNAAGEAIPEFTRYRQFFLSLDVDLARLNPRSKLLKTLCSTFGFIKVPLPTIEYNQQGMTTFHAIYF